MPVMKTLLTLTINILIVMIILMSMTHNNRMHALPRGKHRRQQLEDVNSIGDPLSSSEERRRDFLPSMWVRLIDITP